MRGTSCPDRTRASEARRNKRCPGRRNGISALAYPLPWLSRHAVRAATGDKKHAAMHGFRTSWAFGKSKRRFGAGRYASANGVSSKPGPQAPADAPGLHGSLQRSILDFAPQRLHRYEDHRRSTISRRLQCSATRRRSGWTLRPDQMGMGRFAVSRSTWRSRNFASESTAFDCGIS